MLLFIANIQTIYFPWNFNPQFLLEKYSHCNTHTRIKQQAVSGSGRVFKRKGKVENTLDGRYKQRLLPHTTSLSPGRPLRPHRQAPVHPRAWRASPPAPTAACGATRGNAPPQAKQKLRRSPLSHLASRIESRGSRRNAAPGYVVAAAAACCRARAGKQRFLLHSTSVLARAWNLAPRGLHRISSGD